MAQERIIITRNDLQILEGISESNAKQKIRNVKAHFNVKPLGFITVRQYCAYYNSDYQEYLHAINK